MKRTGIIKCFIIILAVTLVMPICSVFAVESGTSEAPLSLEEFGSIAEIYKALSPELSFEEYLDREEYAHGMIIKRKTGEDAQKSYQSLRSALQILSYVRERFREIERMRAEIFSKPIKSATPGKSVGKDGSVTYSGTNIKIAKYILKKYSDKYPDVSAEDLNEIEAKIDGTLGKGAHKGFSITFDMESKDKLDNAVKIPIQVALRDENTHFLNWSFSKSYAPKFAQDENNPEDMFIYYEPSYNFVKYLECSGDWWGFNSKDTNAFGWASKTYQEIRDSRTGMVKQIEQEVLAMDYTFREAKAYSRKITDCNSDGSIRNSYEQNTRILEFQPTEDDDGVVSYLPKAMETVQFNDSTAPNRETTFYSFYSYDEYDRTDKALTVAYIKDSDSEYFTMSYNNTLEYDPLTGLSALDSLSGDIIPGVSVTPGEALRYGETVWQALNDVDIQSSFTLNSEVEVKNMLWACFDIATQVLQSGFNYDAAKLNALAKHRDAGQSRLIELATQALSNGQVTAAESESIEEQIRELSQIYGNKLSLPTL